MHLNVHFQCTGPPTSLNDRICLPEQIVTCTLQNKLAKCVGVENYFQVGCICTSKCSTVDDCAFFNPTCNLGNNFLTCNNGACSCTPKQCQHNSDCTGSCPAGQKSFCPYASYKCECVPNDYCDYDADCPVCENSAQKRYCGKYDTRYTPGAGFMEVNKCTCLNSDQCQENGDCGTGTCCVSIQSDKTPTGTQNPVHFGNCGSSGGRDSSEWVWLPIIGCPHDNKNGIEPNSG